MRFIFEFVKRRVSKEKIRFTENGFDLDLTCILSDGVSFNHFMNIAQLLAIRDSIVKFTGSFEGLRDSPAQVSSFTTIFGQ